MALKIFTTAIPAGFESGKFIPKALVTQLVQNFVSNTYKTKVGSTALEKVDPNADSYSVWFSKKEIDSLFAANPTTGPAGLRIYFGMHRDTSLEAAVSAQFPHYQSQHTAILVVTQDEIQGAEIIHRDQLNDLNEVGTADPLFGLDEGSICPPPNPCNGSDLIVT